ncbi:uncharacterized protein [Tiliqua scincoides]|uniref:uncharacterized protein n=1 Tax=Tiliqua scincoides TaxID=71010 RepID=UPI00346273E2
MPLSPCLPACPAQPELLRLLLLGLVVGAGLDRPVEVSLQSVGPPSRRGSASAVFPTGERLPLGGSEQPTLQRQGAGWLAGPGRFLDEQPPVPPNRREAGASRPAPLLGSREKGHHVVGPFILARWSPPATLTPSTSKRIHCLFVCRGSGQQCGTDSPTASSAAFPRCLGTVRLGMQQKESPSLCLPAQKAADKFGLGYLSTRNS